MIYRAYLLCFRYLAIKTGEVCYYVGFEEFEKEEPLGSMNCQLMTVKIGASGAKRKQHQFQLVSCANCWHMKLARLGVWRGAPRTLFFNLLLRVERDELC